MPIVVTAKQSGGQTDPMPAGTHHAICYGVIAVGTIPDDKYPSRPKVVLLFETPSERIEIKGKDLPRGISKRYTLSLHEKSALRKEMASWRGRDFTADELSGFEIDKLAGANGLINVIHAKGENGTVYANIAAIMPLPKGTAKKTSENPPLVWNISDAIAAAVKANKSDIEFPATMPEWIQKVVRSSDEYNFFTSGGAKKAQVEADKMANVTHGEQEDSIPF